MIQLHGGREDAEMRCIKKVYQSITSRRTVSSHTSVMFTLRSTRVWKTFENHLQIKIAVLIILLPLVLASEKLCVGLSDYVYVCVWVCMCACVCVWLYVCMVVCV